MFIIDTHLLLNAVNSDVRELTGLHPQLYGISEIRTADTDFHQFPFLDVVNPLTPRPSP